jgi:hypothetical protein
LIGSYLVRSISQLWIKHEIKEFGGTSMLIFRSILSLFALGFVAGVPGVANALTLIGGSTNNGNLDQTYLQEIVPGFFLPKPQVWQNVGTRTISGPYEDEMSSEPWAGPAPTPVTADGGCGFAGSDCAVFFKPFSGNSTNGAATGHLFQNVLGTPGIEYTLTGWAGAEANALMEDAVFALEFLDSGGVEIPGSGTELSLLPFLFVDNREPFDYKEYTVTATAPASTAFVRARASMIGAMANPGGGGQAFVVDDFTLTSVEAVPEPATIALVGLGLVAVLGSHRLKKYVGRFEAARRA